jgi:hypothetical protein
VSEAREFFPGVWVLERDGVVTDTVILVPGPAASGLDEVLGLALSEGIEVDGSRWTARARLSLSDRYGHFDLLRDGVRESSGYWQFSETPRPSDPTNIVPPAVCRWLALVHSAWAGAYAEVSWAERIVEDGVDYGPTSVVDAILAYHDERSQKP